MKFSLSQIFRTIAIAMVLVFAFSALAEQIGTLPAVAVFVATNVGAWHLLGGVSLALGIDGQLTMLDIAKANGSDAVVGLIEENASAYPEFVRFPARTIKGTSYKTLHRTDYPIVGFRGANEGTKLTKSAYANKLTECFIIDAQIRADRAVTTGSEDGPEVVKARESSGVMLGVMRGVAQQIYYGVSQDAKGFPGMVATVDSSHEYDATGASNKSSVWAVKFGLQDVILLGGNGKAIDLTEWILQQVPDVNDATKFLSAECASLMGWVGLQLANKDAFGRIKNLDASTAGKTMSDNLAYELLAKMPANWRPDMWIMNRRSQKQLRQSRATTLVPTPPMPTDIDGTPIMVTDAITSSES